MNIQMIKNPNPIKLTSDEQKAFDDIISELNYLIFGKWKKQKGQVGSKVILEKKVKIHRFNEDSRDVIIRIVGKRNRSQKWNKKVFGQNTGLYYSQAYLDPMTGSILTGKKLQRTYWSGGVGKPETLIEVHISGYVPKNEIFEKYTNDPYSYWLSLVSLKQTLRHEIIHAKDPDRLDSAYSTGDIYDKFKYVVYVNDPNRSEFRAHLAEWDQFTSEIEKVVLNRNENDFYRSVWSGIKDELCSIIESKNRNDDFIEFLMNGKLVPPISAFNLRENKKFVDASESKDRGAISYLESKMKQEVWDTKYNKKMLIYSSYLRFKRQESRKLRVQGFSWDEAKKKAVAIAKEKFKEKYPDASFKKPKRKERFSPKELEKIRKRSRSNYTDLINAIFTMFKDKGLLDKSLCSETKTVSEIASEKRAMTLLKRDKIIIEALLLRFKDIKP